MPDRRNIAVLTLALLAAMGVATPVVGRSTSAGAATTTDAAATTAEAETDSGVHGVVVSAVPAENTPNVQDGSVKAIAEVGDIVIVGGDFTTVRDPGSDVDNSRPYLFAFDKTTGDLAQAFAPAVDGEVLVVTAGPTPDTVFIGGSFNTVNGVTRRKLALLNLADGSAADTFTTPAFNGTVTSLATAGDRLLVGGTFTSAGTAYPRGGLASLKAITGAVDDYLTVTLTGHHNYDGVSGAVGAVGAKKIAVSPDGAQAVVIGNFKLADGATHDQVVKLDLGYTAATIADWNTDSYTPRCNDASFDSYVRDAAYAPDGSYFAIVTTGAKYSDTLCDTAARWSSTATGTAQTPTWVAVTGGDTLLSVAITDQAVYVGGHERWLNNPYGSDTAKAGAVARPGIAALDPANGLPLAWNPGRAPRGAGAGEITVVSDGIWVGSDTEYIGPGTYHRARIAFFPVDGGAAPHPTTTAGLPARIYTAATSGDTLTRRTYSTSSGVGAAGSLTDNAGVAWSSVRGAFWVGNTLFYGLAGNLYRREFDGTTLGQPTLADPYHDPIWDTVSTGSGTTYTGVAPGYFDELADVTGAFYDSGRLYYTKTGNTKIFWRWFAPDSGTVGADRNSEATAGVLPGGMFLTDSTLYIVNQNNGRLITRAWVSGAPSGTTKAISGPDVDGIDWRNAALFLAP